MSIFSLSHFPPGKRPHSAQLEDPNQGQPGRGPTGERQVRFSRDELADCVCESGEALGGGVPDPLC